MTLKMSGAQQATKAFSGARKRGASGHARATSISVSRRPNTNASTDLSHTCLRSACIALNELDKHFCNTRLARMGRHSLWLGRFEECAMHHCFATPSRCNLLIRMRETGETSGSEPFILGRMSLSLRICTEFNQRRKAIRVYFVA